MANISNINGFFTINSDGNIKIGTLTVPTYWSGYTALQLGVDNSIFSNTATGSGSALFIGQNVYNDGSDYLYTGVSNNEAGLVDMRSGLFKFFNAPNGTAGNVATMTQRFTVALNGNVGIGTGNDPDYTLHLLKSSGDTEMYINGQNGQSSLRMGVDLRNWQIKTAATPYLWSLNYAGGDFQTPNIITAKTTGNVGIGTDSPDAKLHIYGSTSLSEMYLGENAATDKAGILKYTQGDGSGTGFITLSHYGNTSTTQSLAIKYGGNVGIGTTSPADKLEIKSGYLRMYDPSSNANAGYPIRWTSNNSATNVTYAEITAITTSAGNRTGDLVFSTSNAGAPTEKMRITKDGFMAVNTSGVIPKFSVQTGTSTVTMPNGRYLNFNTGEINAANFSKSLVCSISDDSAVNQPKQIGLIMHNNSKVDNTFSPGIVFGSQANSGAYADATAMIAGRRLGQVADSNWSAGQLWFWTGTGGVPATGGVASGLPDGFPAMVINENRRVMIGTNIAGTTGQPIITQALQIATGNSNDGIIIHGNGNNDGMGGQGFRKIGFRFDESDASFESEMRFVVTNTGAHGGQLEFWTDDTSGNTTRAMTIDKNQYVGIGTTNPLAKLYIEGPNNLDGNDYAQLYIKGTGTYPADITGIVLDSAGSNQSHIRFHNNGTPKLQIRYNEGDNAVDKLGIYSFTLNTSIAEFNNATGAFVVKGDVTAFGSPSDKRLKENIKPIESALDKVSKLQGVTFDWKEKGITNLKEDIGFIAQDVQKVIPELVRENEDGMLSIRHQGIAPILLEAIKELKQEIEELKNKPCNCK